MKKIVVLLIVLSILAGALAYTNAQAKQWCDPHDIACWSFIERTCLSGFIPVPLRQVCHRFGVNWKKYPTNTPQVPPVETPLPYP